MHEREFKKLCSNLSSLRLGQLLELRAMLSALIDLEEQGSDPPAEQDQARTRTKGREYTNNIGLPGKRGHIEEKMIPRKGKRYGPYLYLRYWFDSRLKSRYIGKPSRDRE